MTSEIKAGNATNGVQITSDSTGILEIKTGTGAGTTALTIGTDQSVNYSGTAQRITGDFSNATVVSRVAFQTSTVNSNTAVLSIPNGTATTAQFMAANNSDPTNASIAQIAALSTDIRILSGLFGTGSYLPMTFYTGGTETARFSATAKTLILSGGDTTANGTGITFPATQSASSNANTLDDYEEGTWIPSVVGNPTPGTTTYGNRTGTYIKIGRQVTCWFRVGYSAATGVGSLLVTGLPFTIQAGGNATGAAMSGNLNWPISGTLNWYAPDNATSLELYVSSDDVNYTAVTISNEVADMIGTITYFVS
jgi:hypothetical protein